MGAASVRSALLRSALSGTPCGAASACSYRVVMPLRVELPHELAEHVLAAASARGVSVEAVVIAAVEAYLPQRLRAPQRPRRLALAGIGESEDGELSQREPFSDL